MDTAITYWLVIALTALLRIMIGKFWYDVVSAKRQQKTSGSSITGLNNVIVGAVVSFFMALKLADFVEDKGILIGALAGFFLGITWVATSVITNYFLTRRSSKLYAIDEGYNIIAFTIMGVVFGVILN